MTEVISKTQAESMCRHPHQRAQMHGQPYTLVTPIQTPLAAATPEGVPELSLVIEYQIIGHTLEDKFENEEWTKVWEVHDLGRAVSLSDAHQVAASWRATYVGEYPIL